MKTDNIMIQIVYIAIISNDFLFLKFLKFTWW